MKRDNFVIGVSSIDSSMINLWKRVWSSQTLHADALVLGFFAWVLVLFCIHRDFAEFTDYATHPPWSPMKGNAQVGNPIALANQGYTFSILTLRKRTSNLGSLGFHSQVYYSPRDKRGNIGFSSA